MPRSPLDQTGIVYFNVGPPYIKPPDSWMTMAYFSCNPP